MASDTGETHWMRSLPNGKPISALGFGCSSLWSKRSFDPEEAQAILETADQNGINHFDTGPSYADGEVRLARFLKGRDLSRYVISTKVGTHQAEDGSLSRSFAIDDIRRSFDKSMHRLGIDKVDILYLHGPNVTVMSDPVFRFFDDLKRDGRIVYSGINSFDPPIVEAMLANPIDAVMLQYSLADLRFEALMKRLQAAGKIITAGTILAQGIFDLRAFLPTNRKKLWYLLRALKNEPLFPIKGPLLARRLRSTGLGAHEAAVRFAVSHPSITSCLFGTTRQPHVTANAAWAKKPMEAGMRARLAGRGY